jgi:DNA-binding response OmpR family regulator
MYNPIMSKHVVVIHPDTEMQKYLQTLLIDRGYRVTTFNKGVELVNSILEVTMDLIISSYELEDIDGGTLFDEVGKTYPEVHVIFIAAIKDEATIVELLKKQKCEVMMLPIVPVELLARVKALTDCDPEIAVGDGCLVVGDLELDTKSKLAKRKDKKIVLTPTEYRLLEYLMENAGIVVTRDMILNKVWNTSEDVSDRIVDVYIGYLREKIDSGFKKKLVSTSPGFGYCITKD